MDCALLLQEQLRAAAQAATPLRITGGGSKPFYGRPVFGQPLDVRAHTGIVSYEPTELVVTARCGTPLAELEAVLAEHGQMLPFEPPHFSSPRPLAGEGLGVRAPATATVGGMVATGLSGPRRPWGGAVRDAVLGVTVLSGQGEVLRFGGQVMKNVAGYDVSRLMVGSLGSLGVILEASIRVLPCPAKEITLVQDADAATALARLTAWQRLSLPLSASVFDGQRLWLRLSGTHAGVNAARAVVGGEEAGSDEMASERWAEVRDQRLPFFQTTQPIWRLSVPPATPVLSLAGEGLVEWGGAQRWLISDESPARIRAVAASVGGHATLFHNADGQAEIFHPLPAPMLALQQRLKARFDPAGILNPGVLYAGL